MPVKALCRWRELDVLSFFGAMPFYLSREIPLFEDALFEVISGFTTTGASILTDVEALSKCMLIWRSFTHWIGGMACWSLFWPCFRLREATTSTS